MPTHASAVGFKRNGPNTQYTPTPNTQPPTPNTPHPPPNTQHPIPNPQPPSPQEAYRKPLALDSGYDFRKRGYRVGDAGMKLDHTSGTEVGEHPP